MPEVKLVKSHPLFTQIDRPEPVLLGREDYQLRLRLLVERMGERDVDTVLIYGDREHFSNIEYFTSYDCRFEECLLLADREGHVTLIAGNEGLAYSEQVPYPIRRMLYQNFSLQGQPRERLRPLSQLLAEAGIRPGGRVGVVGMKYFEDGCEGDPAHTFDIPAYILAALYRLCPGEQVVSFGRELTGYPDGIRLTLHSAREIAWAEYAGCRSAGAVQRMLRRLKPGISELELSACAMGGLEPLNVHPMINFGPRSVELGLKSPLPGQTLSLGDVCGICYSVRGNLTSKISVAAYDLNSWKKELRPYYETFYKKHFAAMAAWYEAAGVGARCGEMYRAVYRSISREEHGITLNPGHGTGTEEWLNSAFSAESTHTLLDGEFLQADIIASGSCPVRTSICEDAVVVASRAGREELMRLYPAVWGRISARQRVMREVLNIQISDDVLPMSNLNGVYYPFMLNLDTVFAMGT